MNFCDIPAEAFPKGAQFYHNVIVMVFSVAEDIWNEDFDSIWYLDQLTAPKSKAILFLKEKEKLSTMLMQTSFMIATMNKSAIGYQIIMRIVQSKQIQMERFHGMKENFNEPN